MPAMVLVALGIMIREGQAIVFDLVQFRAPLLLLSFIIEVSGLFIAIPIWRQILSSHNVKLSLRDDIRIYNYSALGHVLPGGIWTIVSRATLYQQLGVQGLQVASASVMETLIIGVSGIGVYGISVILNPEINLLQRPELGIILTFAALMFLHPRIFSPIFHWIAKRSSKSFRDESFEYSSQKLATWILIESGTILIGGLAVFTLLGSLGEITSGALIPVIASWASATAASSLLFWLPGSPLLRDGAMVIALSPILPLSSALFFVVIVRLWSIGSLVLLAFLVWLVFGRSGN